MRAYYNENDPHAAEWLRELIRVGLIAPGDVDDRSIADVRPNDLRGYDQCHFFAGIGGWSYALRLAGWDDSRPVWTGSCPCQPFSIAGKRGGNADERHLWPEFRRLIEECGPSVVFGEQVAGADGREWLARVRADLEALGYAVGAGDLCAAGIGAPHIRQRLYWVANTDCDEYRGSPRSGEAASVSRVDWTDFTSTGKSSRTSLFIRDRMGDASGARLAQREIFGGASGETVGGATREGAFSGGDVVQCRDGWRRSKSIVQCMADGLSARMVSMCDESKTEKINGAPANFSRTEDNTNEPPDIVRLLPQAGTFAQLYGDERTTQALLALRDACYESRAVLDSSHSLDETWRSLGTQGQTRLLMELGTRGFTVTAL